MKKTTQITVETHRVLVLRTPKRSLLAACTTCASQTLMLMPDEAAALARVSTRTIYRLIEAEQLHVTETASGQMLVCFNSLAASVKQSVARCNQSILRCRLSLEGEES